MVKDLQEVIYGAVIIVIILFAPGGLYGLVQRLSPVDLREKLHGYSPPMTKSSEIFRTDRVTVEFGGLTALKNVSVRVEKGEVRGIIGPNGAGKTTFFNAVTRFVPITSGEVFFEGENITPLPPHAIARKGVIRTFQKRGIISSLTAMENVLTGCTPDDGRFEPLRHLLSQREVR